MTVICLIGLQLISLVINKHAPLLFLGGGGGGGVEGLGGGESLFGIYESFVLLLAFSLWAKHGGHLSGFSGRI